MLELQGRLWLVEYVAAMYVEYEKDMIYRVYITEAIKNYMRLNMGYWELINKRNEKEETRSAEEIKQSFMERLNGKE